jgi:hypothetical protein
MTIFERHAKIVIMLLWGLGIIISLIIAEYLASTVGLGRVVVYEVNPLYGYRPGPNQTVTRQNATVQLNNLGIRADQDWAPSYSEQRILFLGDSITYGGSYIDNTQLFSTLALINTPSVLSGNAGVNGWGVSNVSGLVVDANFTPAQYYISTFADEDFSRGLNRVSGSPFWPSKPRYALSELFHYLVYKLSLQKFNQLDYPMDKADKTAVKHKAVQDLQRMHTYLTSLGYEHRLVITPTKRQMTGESRHDEEIKSLLTAAGLDAIYLKDYLALDGDIERYYHDAAHLSVEGHQAWAQVYQKIIQSML